MKFFYICALLLPIIVSAYPSRDGSLSILKGKFRLNKIDENVNEEVNADDDHVPNKSNTFDENDQMPVELQNLDLTSLLSEIIGNLLKEKLHELPDMAVASDDLDNNNETDLKPDVSIVSDSKNNLVPDDDLATNDLKPDIFVFPDAENNFVPDLPEASDVYYKNFKMKGLLNKINY